MKGKIISIDSAIPLKKLQPGDFANITISNDYGHMSEDKIIQTNVIVSGFTRRNNMITGLTFEVTNSKTIPAEKVNDWLEGKQI